MQYRIEFINYLSSIYEEDEYELNENLITKKIVFLLLDIATDKGVEDYKAVKAVLKLWKEKKLRLPKKPIQYELLKLALNIT